MIKLMNKLGKATWLLGSLISIVAALGTPSTAAASTGKLFITRDTALTQDHTGHIVIAADGVKLDCAGRTITSPSPGSGIGISIDHKRGVEVRNCNVTGFERGVWLRGLSSSRLTNNRADGNFVGFFLETINPASNNALEENEATRNAVGFFLLEVNESNFRRNRVNGNSIGFEIEAAHNNMLSENEANGNEWWGFGLFASANNTMIKNRACGSGAVDVSQHASSTGNTFVDNDFCTTRGIHREPSNGGSEKGG